MNWKELALLFVLGSIVGFAGTLVVLETVDPRCPDEYREHLADGSSYCPDGWAEQAQGD